jgi:hypothetical protein
VRRPLVFALTPLLLAQIAHADDGAPFVNGGALVGLGLHNTGTGVVVGAEVSAGYLLDDTSQLAGAHRFASAVRMPWFGGYIDVLYDNQLGQGRGSFGPEIGYGLVGVDGGLVVAGPHEGVAARIVLTTSVVAIYARYEHIFNTAGESSFVELGLLLKYPHVFRPRAD